MSLRFGTDGVRGVAGRELTPELVLLLGRVAARHLSVTGRPWMLGRDTRRSGAMLGAALAAGLTAEGADVVDLGVVPTPVVASLAAREGAPGAVISASHNPFADNGVKLFAAGGKKLSADVEGRIEADLLDEPVGDLLSGVGIGRLRSDGQPVAWYRDRIVGALEGRRLDGLRVVVDAGHGGAVTTAVECLRAAGAHVVGTLGVEPDGDNINEGCGSTDPSGLAAAVVTAGADLGLAFDGDADRLIAVDGLGRVVDGDRLLALFAADLADRGRLAGSTVVVTVMTNLGFHHAMAARGISVHQTPVGDRHVLAALDEHGWSLGGEQSGHLVFADLATTGDGVLSGLLLLDLLARSGRSLADLAGSVMDRMPQVLRNVAVADQTGLAGAGPVWAEVAAVERELGGEGRVLLRPSGTERLVRVMVEAPTDEAAAQAAERLVAAVSRALG